MVSIKKELKKLKNFFKKNITNIFMSLLLTITIVFSKDIYIENMISDLLSLIVIKNKPSIN
jgi:predicted negative regulator of RcsB-dependent stress response